MTPALADFRAILEDPSGSPVGPVFGPRPGMPLRAARQRDRRQGLAELLSALTRSLDRRHDISLMRGAFEETLRHMVPLRTVHLREAGSRWTNRPETICGPEAVALELPGTDPVLQGALEATFDPGCCLGEWDFQMLGLAAPVGAFGIEDRTATGVRGRRGKFEAADGGTLFLDEVPDLSASAQAKLLRAIQDLAVERVGGQGTHRVDIRIVAATNRSLLELVGQRLFRPDLFYRLSGVDIRVPTLRERRPDILELAHYFLERYRSTRPLTLSASAADALMTYDWPGNVRELERLMERAVTLAESDVIELDDLPPTIRGDYAAALGPSVRRNDSLRAWASRYARLVL